MKTYTVILGDKIWKHGGKRKTRTFTINAETEAEAKRAALDKLKLVENVLWKPAWAEARELVADHAVIAKDGTKYRNIGAYIDSGT